MSNSAQRSQWVHELELSSQRRTPNRQLRDHRFFENVAQQLLLALAKDAGLVPKQGAQEGYEYESSFDKVGFFKLLCKPSQIGLTINTEVVRNTRGHIKEIFLEFHANTNDIDQTQGPFTIHLPSTFLLARRLAALVSVRDHQKLLIELQLLNQRQSSGEQIDREAQMRVLAWRARKRMTQALASDSTNKDLAP